MIKQWPLGILLLVGLLAAGTVSGQESAPGYRVVAYFTSWSIYARNYFVTDIPAEKLTHINYAFFNISEAGECILGDPWADVEFPYPGDADGETLRGNFKQLALLKEQHPGLQTLMSIGGWTWSGRFSDTALTAESREKFARSCIALMTQYGFDGLDIDWEYPGGGGLEGNAARPEDTVNFTLLLAELRAQLDAQGAQDERGYLLTIAAPAGSQYRQMELDKIHDYLDWINVMTYDFAGGWSARTGFNASLYGATSADTALRAYLEAGIPAAKLQMGVPFYGRGFAGVADTDDGVNQPFNGLPKGSWEPGFFDYSDLAANYVGAFERHWDETARVPWLYSATEGVMISYDDAESLVAKADYVRDAGLGGVMIWELSADDDANTLLATLYDRLNGGE